MTTRTATIILAGGQGERLLPLTSGRPKPAVPFGGIFRIIDFTLSNCFNSGLRQLYLLTQYKYEELNGYVREGWSSAWNDFRWDGGEYLLCLPPASGKRYRGNANAMLQNLAIIERQRPEFVLILSGDHIYHMDYRELIDRHAKSGAGLTIATAEQPLSDAGRFGVVEADTNLKVTRFVEKPSAPRPVRPGSDKALVNMGVYIFTTHVLIQALREDAHRLGSSHDFGKDIIPLVMASETVCAYGFQRYWRDIGTIDSYHAANMDLTGPDPLFDPYDNDGWLTRPAGPAGLHPARASHRVHGKVIDSIVSPGVQVALNAVVGNSVLMRNAKIGTGARLRRAIVEEGVEIPAGVQIGFDRSDDRARFIVTENGVVVVTRHSVEARPNLKYRTATLSQGALAAS